MDDKTVEMDVKTVEGIPSIDLNEIRKRIFGKVKVDGSFKRSTGVVFKDRNDNLYRGIIYFSNAFTDYNLNLNDTVKIGSNGLALNKPGTMSIPVIDINETTLERIPTESVGPENAKVLGMTNIDNIQGDFNKDMNGFVLFDSNDKIHPVPIRFKQKTISDFEPVITPITPEAIIDELPQQSESTEFNDKLKKLSDIAEKSKVILEGSKIKDAIEKALSKDTQSNLEARYESLKESIKAPVEKLNKQFTDSLEKIAKVHNAGISALIEKTSKAALETRRKYKNILNKTRSAIKDRLSGKSMGVLGSLKSSKLQNLEKSLGKDEAELDVEIKLAERYTIVKRKLNDWCESSSDKTISNDKTKVQFLEEAQIETIVEAIPLTNVDTVCKQFIYELNYNIMSLIANLLYIVCNHLKNAAKSRIPQNVNFLYGVLSEYVKYITQSSRYENNNPGEEEVEKLTGDVDTTIENFINFTDNTGHFTSMKLHDIRNKLLDLLDTKTPESDNSSDKGSSSSNTRIINNGKYEGRHKRLRETQVDFDYKNNFLRPVIDDIRKRVLELIPDIKSGQILLTTHRKQPRSLFFKERDLEKHYYLDVDGTVKKIGSNMTYKLAINDDGSIPPQLKQLGSVKSVSIVSKSDLSKVSMSDVKPSQSKSANIPFYDSTFTNESRTSSLVLTAPYQSNLTTEGAQSAPAPAPAPKGKSKNRAVGFLTSLGKGVLNRFGARTSSKNRPSEGGAGGRRRTRKFRKNKTHKRR
jgi:hypothetical protein